MVGLEITSAITAIANVMACSLNDNELALAAASLTQLGDTLATIALQREICKQRREELTKKQE